MTTRRSTFVKPAFSWTEAWANVLACALVVALVLIPSGIGALFIALVAKVF